MSFAQRLKQARVEKGVSQVKLAEKIGVARSNVSLWESAEGGLPVVDVLVRIAKYFGKSERWFATGEPGEGDELSPRDAGIRLFLEEIEARKPAQLDAAREWIDRERFSSYFGTDRYTKFDWFEKLQELFNADRKAAADGTRPGFVAPSEEDPHEARERASIAAIRSRREP